MTKILRKIKTNWKEILAFLLVAAALIGAVVGISSAVEKDKTISSFAFARGAIDEEGLYVESDRSIYTKDLIECQGLKIEPDFEATGTYQVFYYTENKTFLGVSELLDSGTDGVYEKGDSFPLAKYCRVMITPEVPKDEDGYIDEDFKIRFYNVSTYASQYTISVKKDQKFVWKDVYAPDSTMNGKYYSLAYSNIQSASQYCASKIVDVGEYTEVAVVIYNYSGNLGIPMLCFADGSGSFIETVNIETPAAEFITDNTVCITLTIPEAAESFALNYITGSSCCIFVK